MIAANEKKLKNDVEEIIEFINASQLEITQKYDISLKKITEIIKNEDYRNACQLKLKMSQKK